MTWRPPRGNESTPTYRIEEDAPPWVPPIPPETRWTRKQINQAQEPVYDAYPDRAIGEPIAQPEPKEVVQLTKKVGLKLIIQGPTLSKEVPLERGFLEMFKTSSRLQQAYLAHLVSITAKDIADEEGQGLAEYALIIALVAIVVIVAALFLGTQISSILNNIGASV